MKNTRKASKLLETIELLKNRLEQLQEEIPEATDDYHRLFLYFVGEQFEGISPDKIRICDGSPQGDQKIDFYDAGEDRFVAYQCKLPEFERLEERKSVRTYGADLVNEAEDVLTFLTDKSGNATGSAAAQEARARFRSYKRMSEEANQAYPLEIVLACFGRLTSRAKEKLIELRNLQTNNSEALKIRVIDYDTIASELSLSSMYHPLPSEIKLEYKKGTSVNTGEWAYALVPAFEFYQQFDKYKMTLFDRNVRHYLERSSVNKQIINTLDTKSGQERFHLLNNGITLSASNCSFSTDAAQVTVHDPQIINGCQTVISIFRAYNQINEESKRQNFQENCYVAVRIIQTQDTDLLEELVTTSNNQNKMSPRNLRSNSRTQRLLQRKFDQLEYRYFYQRKDGEFESIREYGHGQLSTFKRKHYQYSSKGHRQIDNEDLAKAWLSFIGFSKDASEKINAFEMTDEGGRYEWLFERCPSTAHWEAITLGPQVEYSDENFEPSVPEPTQYLLSYLIYRFIKSYLPSPQANRSECVARLKGTGAIATNPSAEELNTALMANEVYVRNQILYNMKEVIVELYAWILIKVYGPLNADTAARILQLSGIRDLYQTPDFRSVVRNLRTEEAPENLLHNVLFTCFEFIREAVNRWKSEHEKEYLGQQRRIRYLHSIRVVEQMKDTLNNTNESTRQFGYDWKPPKIEFLKTLPELSSKP